MIQRTDKARQEAQEAEEGLTKDALPVHSLAVKRTANPRLQEIINQVDGLPISERPSLDISVSLLVIFYLILGNHKIFLTRQEICNIQTKLIQEEFFNTIQHLTGIIRNQQYQE